MTDDEARKLATRAIDTWPSGPKAYIWINDLKPLDLGIATAAMRQLRQHGADVRNLLAEFHTAYRETKRRANANDALAVPARCQLCNGTGWVEATPAEAHLPTHCKGTPGAVTGDGGCHCHAVHPCNCSNGQQARVIAELIQHERNRA